MKRLFITLFAASATVFALAQDVIFLGSNDSIVAKVITVGTSEITYQKWTNLQGPIYTMFINQIAAIRYANGTYDFFNNTNMEKMSENISDNIAFETIGNNIENTEEHISIVLPVNRYGNTYECNELIMNRWEFEEWLKKQNNSTAAYKRFYKGTKLAEAGWALMATGLMCDLFGTIVLVFRKDTPDGLIFTQIGTALEIACIPAIAIGYSKMHRSVDVYNASCGNTTYIQPYWAVQASSNGIGLAYHF